VYVKERICCIRNVVDTLRHREISRRHTATVD